MIHAGDADLRGVGHIAFDAIAIEQAGSDRQLSVEEQVEDSYTNPSRKHYQYEASLGWLPKVDGLPPSVIEEDTYAFLATLGRKAEPGTVWEYASVNTMMLAWIAEEVTGKVHGQNPGGRPPGDPRGVGPSGTRREARHVSMGSGFHRWILLQGWFWWARALRRTRKRHRARLLRNARL